MNRRRGKDPASLASRSMERRRRIQTHRSSSFREAEAWDLAFWQAQGEEARLSALVAIREDVRKAEAARDQT